MEFAGGDRKEMDTTTSIKAATTLRRSFAGLRAVDQRRRQLRTGNDVIVATGMRLGDQRGVEMGSETPEAMHARPQVAEIRHAREAN